MDPVKTQLLFEQTLVGDYESEEAWAAVSALRMDGSREIFEYAETWCCSDDPLKRARATAILCQLRRPPPPDSTEESERIFRDESYETVTNMLVNEQNPLVLDSAIHALGHLGNWNAIPTILAYQDHPEPDVRYAVAFALSCFPNDPQSVRGLTTLTTDSCSDVRDWAVFGLGVLGDCDSSEIREVFLRCLNDADEDVREEAAVSLGKRHDKRLIPMLWAMLDKGEVTGRVAEAALELLDLDEAPEWTTADYKAALHAKFDLQE